MGNDSKDESKKLKELEKRFREAIEYGKKLYEKGLVDGASGNLSFRINNKFFITKTGVNLELLNRNSFVELEVKEQSLQEIKNRQASSDGLVHIKTYLKTDYKVILHCHGVYNVVLSVTRNKIEPLDLEGKLFLGEIEVLEGQFMTEEIAEIISDSISKKGYAVAKRHGIYATGNSFREAFNLISYVEHSCQIIYLKELLEK